MSVVLADRLPRPVGQLAKAHSSGGMSTLAALGLSRTVRLDRSVFVSAVSTSRNPALPLSGKVNPPPWYSTRTLPTIGLPSVSRGTGSVGARRLLVRRALPCQPASTNT